MKLIARSILTLIITFTLFQLSQTSVSADPFVREDCVDANGNAVPLNVCKYGKDSLGSDMTNLGCYITGCVTTEGEPTHTGAIPTFSNYIAFMVTDPPVETGEYVADVMHNMGIVEPSYAQGIGFAALNPVLTLWKAFRNIAYFLFIIIFIVIGFMIMFRTQISPQAVVTVQTALPKLIITLILITFSYAIAGFVVDMMYLSIFLIIEIFEQFGIINDVDAARNAIFGLSIFRIALRFFIAPGEAAGAAANAVSAIASGILGVPTGGIGIIFDIVVDTLAYLVIAIAMLIALFRTFFGLLLAYVGIIMATIFAPIQLLMNAFPNQSTFSNWLKGLVANAAVFPAVAVVILIAAHLVGGDSNPPLGVVTSNNVQGLGEGSGFIPPFITTQDADEQFGVEHIRAIIGLGMILLLPEVLTVVKKIMGVEAGMADTIGGAGLNPLKAPAVAIGGAGALIGGAIGTAQGREQLGRLYESYRTHRSERRSGRPARDGSRPAPSGASGAPVPGTTRSDPSQGSGSDEQSRGRGD